MNQSFILLWVFYFKTFTVQVVYISISSLMQEVAVVDLPFSTKMQKVAMADLPFSNTTQQVGVVDGTT